MSLQRQLWGGDEDQVVKGSGAGENLTGTFPTSGTQTAGPPGTSVGYTELDLIRRAQKLNRVNGLRELRGFWSSQMTLSARRAVSHPWRCRSALAHAKSV